MVFRAVVTGVLALALSVLIYFEAWFLWSGQGDAATCVVALEVGMPIGAVPILLFRLWA